MSDYIKNYQLLAAAIVIQAANDYRSARRTLKHVPVDNDAKHRYKRDKAYLLKKECEHFFLGDWIKHLTDHDGKKMLYLLQSEKIK